MRGGEYRALWKGAVGNVVVGYYYGCPEVCEALERRAGGDAAVDGHEQVGHPAVKAAGHGGVGEAVAF